jgi:hypothetical protein
VAKAGLWAITDAEERKRGERTGLDELVLFSRKADDKTSCIGESPICRTVRLRSPAWQRVTPREVRDRR